MGLFFFNLREPRTEWIAGGVGNMLIGIQRREVPRERDAQ